MSTKQKVTRESHFSASDKEYIKRKGQAPLYKRSLSCPHAILERTMNSSKHIPSDGSLDKRLAMCAAEASKLSILTGAFSDMSSASNPDIIIHTNTKYMQILK